MKDLKQYKKLFLGEIDHFETDFYNYLETMFDVERLHLSLDSKRMFSVLRKLERDKCTAFIRAFDNKNCYDSFSQRFSTNNFDILRKNIIGFIYEHKREVNDCPTFKEVQKFINQYEKENKFWKENLVTIVNFRFLIYLDEPNEEDKKSNQFAKIKERLNQVSQHYGINYYDFFDQLKKWKPTI